MFSDAISIFFGLDGSYNKLLTVMEIGVREFLVQRGEGGKWERGNSEEKGSGNFQL